MGIIKPNNFVPIPKIQIYHVPAPEIISILDFLPLLDDEGKNTPTGEIVDLRANAFLRNRRFIKRKFHGLFQQHWGDEVPETLETIDDTRSTRKLVTAKQLLQLPTFWQYRALGRNFDYYTDTSFQAVELLFSTSELFAGAFSRIENYSVTNNQYNLKDKIKKHIPDFHYNMATIDTSMKSGLVGWGSPNGLYNMTRKSIGSLAKTVRKGNYDAASDNLVSFFNGERDYSIDTVISLLDDFTNIRERIAFLFFMLGHSYARKTKPNIINLDEWTKQVKDILTPERNSGYNFFKRESKHGKYKGYEEYLEDIFDNTVENQKTSFEINEITQIKTMLELFIDTFIDIYYSNNGFFKEHTFIDNFYRKIGDVWGGIFPDDDWTDCLDDIFVSILKNRPGWTRGIKQVAGYYENYYKKTSVVSADDGSHSYAFSPEDEFHETLIAGDTENYYKWHRYSVESSQNKSRIFEAVKSLNEKWGDGTNETETCILLIVLNIMSLVARSSYIQTEQKSAAGAFMKYYTNLDDDIDWYLSYTFDNKHTNRTTNALHNSLIEIYLICADSHYHIARHVAGLKSIEVLFSNIENDISKVKYMNNEALKAMLPHKHLLTDHNYKHGFRIRHFFDLLQQHEDRFTPQKFNLAKTGSYKLLQSYMTEDKCKMSKKSQCERKKKIFSIGIKDNAIKNAISNLEKVSGDHIVKLKIFIEKELAVFDGIKFKPLEFEFDISSFAALNSYEIAGLTNTSNRELLFETTDDIVASTSFNEFISNNMKLIKFKNSFKDIEDFMSVDSIESVDKIIKNGIESDVLKEYIYRVYGIDMSETTFISNRKGPDSGARKIINNKFGRRRFKSSRSLLLNKSIFFNGDKFTYEILQKSKFEKIINILVDVENDFVIDLSDIELNSWTNLHLLNEYSTADHYDFKVSFEVELEEV